MKKVSILTLLATLLLASKLSAQTDSISLKVTKARSADNKTYYWLKDIETKDNYYTVCSCIQKHQKGDIVKIAKKDMEIINPGLPVTFDKPIRKQNN